MLSRHLLKLHTRRTSSYLFSTTRTFSDKDVSHFRSFLSQNELVQGQNTNPYNQDWTGRFQGNSGLVLIPDSIQKISQILQYCNKEKIAVTPQGGNTGIHGGAIASNKEVIVSLSNLNKIYNFHTNLSVISCQAGCTLGSLNQYLASHGYEIPVDVPAQDKAQIGGLISTNARPIRLTKFGSFKSHILGLEAVTAEGEILDMSSIIRKDNTGLDMKQLFIGAEGSMGIITRVDILAHTKPQYRKSALFTTDSFNKALDIAELCRDNLGRHMSTLEFRTDLKSEKRDYTVYLLASGQEDMEAVVGDVVDKIKAKNLINSSQVASTDEEINSIYNARASIMENIRKQGFAHQYDIEIEPKSFEEFASTLKKNFSDSVAFEAYGYVGDGTNIHIALASKSFKETESKFEPILYDTLQKFGGIVSAEHGIGQVRPEFFKRTSKTVAINFMKRFKKTFDPNNIMNPGKVYLSN